MTVGELIDWLQQFDPALKVVGLYDNEQGSNDITAVRDDEEQISLIVGDGF